MAGLVGNCSGWASIDAGTILFLVAWIANEIGVVLIMSAVGRERNAAKFAKVENMLRVFADAGCPLGVGSIVIGAWPAGTRASNVILLAHAVFSVPFLVKSTSFNTKRTKSQETVFAVALVGLNVQFLTDIAFRRANAVQFFKARVADALSVILTVAGVGWAGLALEGSLVEEESGGNTLAAGSLGVGGGVQGANCADTLKNTKSRFTDAFVSVPFLIQVSASLNALSINSMEAKDAIASASLVVGLFVQSAVKDAGRSRGNIAIIAYTFA